MDAADVVWTAINSGTVAYAVVVIPGKGPILVTFRGGKRKAGRPTAGRRSTPRGRGKVRP